MRLYLIFIFLLIIPVSYAVEISNYSNYDEMSFIYSASSKINIDVTGDNPKIMDLNAKIGLIPKKGDRQIILNQEVITEPKTYINYDPEFDKNVELTWKNLNSKSIYYEMNSRLLTKNVISKIKKIKFPMEGDFGEEIDEYKKATEFIDVTDDIKKKANEIVEGETDSYKAIYKLAEWVRNNINYDLNTLTEDVVQKSSWVLMTRRGVCDEMTNLFMSLCRSLGIPVRFITGLAYSNTLSDFGNHGWAEVYFPGQGWVPFDITYCEYGWVDATHIKLSEDKDSNVMSVDYNWKSRDVDVKTEDLTTKVTLLNSGKKIEPLTRLEINLLENNVGFGSYVPVQVVVENLKDYSVIDKVYLTKAPEIIDESNTRAVFLESDEIKEEYWIVHVPKEMDDGYEYSSLITANSAFGASADGSLMFSEGEKIISRAEAESKIEKLRKREEKKYFLNLDFKCNLLKEKYYSNENVEVICNIKNNGNALLKELQVCLREDCEKFDLGITEEREIGFESYVSKKIDIIAENEEMIKHIYLEPEIIEVPEFEIKDLKPTEIDYIEKKEFSFVLEANYDAYDVDVVVEDKKTHFDLFHGKRAVDVELSGNKLVNGFDIKIAYKDKEGKEYIKKEKLNVVVNNVPWYAKIFRWFSMI